MSARPTFAMLAVSLAACSGASCASNAARQADGGAAPGAEQVALRFAWPDGFRARVALEHQTLREGDPPTRAVVRHELTTERKGGEIFVRTSGTEGEGDEPELQLNLAIGEALVQVVGRDGAFKRAEGIDRAVELLRRGGADEPSGRTARDSIGRQVREDWEMTVGAWRGRSLAAGRPVTSQQEGALALLPAVTGTMDVELLFHKRVPCEEGQAEARCVELARTVRPAKKSEQEILAQVAAALPGPQGAALKSVSASSEQVLTTEPDTLVPHRLLLRDQVILTLTGPDGAPRVVTERSEDAYRFAPELDL
ncbi:hypothetical protein [Anaeromyxobacter paludicola]|uniref:Lipoprotein n=1 Tax=Anaeromyxobacter paludicola TaxID=2918171 RepID=A0ABN6N574_9BACT|nr:hypothetical protein [Anaeromyxobacter paludicola]BDG08291.1 hypothetical protein AMPC_14040 [Anaeromyxobacter paludicola]